MSILSPTPCGPPRFGPPAPPRSSSPSSSPSKAWPVAGKRKMAHAESSQSGGGWAVGMHLGACLPLPLVFPWVALNVPHAVNAQPRLPLPRRLSGGLDASASGVSGDRGRPKPTDASSQFRPTRPKGGPCDTSRRPRPPGSMESFWVLTRSHQTKEERTRAVLESLGACTA